MPSASTVNERDVPHALDCRGGRPWKPNANDKEDCIRATTQADKSLSRLADAGKVDLGTLFTALLLGLIGVNTNLPKSERCTFRI